MIVAIIEHTFSPIKRNVTYGSASTDIWYYCGQASWDWEPFKRCEQITLYACPTYEICSGLYFSQNHTHVDSAPATRGVHTITLSQPTSCVLLCGAWPYWMPLRLHARPKPNRANCHFATANRLAWLYSDCVQQCSVKHAMCSVKHDRVFYAALLSPYNALISFWCSR